MKTTPGTQLRIKAKCFHPSDHFVRFAKKDVEQSIAQRFEHIACTYPERLALKHGDRLYTYASLNRAANTLAHLLLESSEECVALLSDRTRGIVSILAILKAGKRYVALDPGTPVERNAFYLRDAGAGLLITDHEHFGAARALAQEGQRIINLEALGPGKDSNPGVNISPDAVAAIFYTSGSTGEPKGVVQSHRNILHDAFIRVNDYHLCDEDRVATTYSLSFSGSIRSVFPALLVGSSLFPYELSQNAVRDFARWVEEQNITIVVLWRQVFGEFVGLRSQQLTFSHVRLLLMGSELIHTTDVEAFQKHMPDACILSIQYSITEAGAITRHLTGKRSVVDDDAPSAPVGYPCTDTEVCLVDGKGHEVANGEVGEIVIKSRYLSAGYWQRADLTNRVFTADPSHPLRRIYRTGDLGRFSPEGCLFHLGRNDSQVKIRGYRVEIIEVEQLLLKHPSVQHAVIKSIPQGNGDHRLVGYVVAVGGTTPTVSALRRHMAKRLADYMIPSTFILMDVFPTTIGGKVDRNALPAPGRTRPVLDQPYWPPNTALERQLVQIWGDLLHLDRVGIHDNFFELGGQSLLATQLVARIRESLEADVAISDFLGFSTIARLAELIETMRWLAEPMTVDPGGSESETF